MINDDDTKTLTAAEVKKLALLAAQAACLPGMLTSVPHMTSSLTVSMLISCSNMAEDIQIAINKMLKVSD